MTLDPAAQAAADRLCDGQGKFELRVAYERDLCVRAFRQGAQWQQQELTARLVQMHAYSSDDMTIRHRRVVLVDELEAVLATRGEPLITSPRPSTGSTAADHEVK